MVGVAIGTLVAMLFRTIEFMYHTSKYILKRSQKENIKKLLITIIEMLIIVPIGFFINRYIKMDSYLSWVVLAMIVGIISCIITIGINAIIYRKELKGLGQLVKRVLKKDKG